MNTAVGIGEQERARLAAAWTLALAVHAGLFLLVGATLVESARFAVDPGWAGAELELDAWVEPAPASPAQPAPVDAAVVTEPTPPPEMVPKTANEPVPLPPPVAAESSPARPLPPAPTAAPAVDAAPVPRFTAGTAAPARAPPAIPVAPDGPAPGPAAVVVRARPQYERNPPPPYPRSARRQGLEGVVLLEVRVSPRGTAEGLRVVQSSGHAVLDQAALRAVKDWRFRPARAGQVPIASTVEVPLRFTLEGAAIPR